MMRCYFCDEWIVDGTSIYCCEKCGFYVHESCARLSQIQHPRHEHPLDLLPENYYRCVEFGRGCDFELDTSLAIRTLWVEKYYRSMLLQEAGDGESRLQLAAHPHPLTSFPARRGIRCGGCRMLIEEEEEEAYGCRDCNFFLHEACAKAPLVVKRHPFHPQHRLHLHCCPDDLECRMCGMRSSIGYSCRNCEFFLDLSCVIGTMPCEEADDDEREEIRRRSPVTDHSLHPHQLSSYHSKTETYIDCRICVTQIPSGDFFGCPDCEFFLHESCAQPPLDVIQRYFHPEHTLTFIRYPKSEDDKDEENECPESEDDEDEENESPKSKDDEDEENECQICGSGLIGSYCGYTCEMGDFFIHQTCVSAILSDLEEGAGMTVQCSFHEHELKLYHNDEHRKCTVCDWTIPRQTLAYKCLSQGCEFRLHKLCEHQSSEFRLHKSCAQLPSELEHLSHSLHPLALCFKPPNEDDDIRCPCCYRKTSGHFAFSCGECNFYLHANCAQKPTLKHPFHDHILFFYSLEQFPTGKNFRCRACLKTCSFNFFRCSGCDFNLHYECSQLPPIVKSNYHWEPLVLCESYIEDDSGDYNCDICELRRDPNKPVYICETCEYKFIAHIECALSPVKMEVSEEGDIITRNEAIRKREKEVKLTQEQVDAEEERLKPLLAKLESMRAKLESTRAELKELETERAKWIDMEAIEEESGSGSTDGEEDESIRREESGSGGSIDREEDKSIRREESGSGSTDVEEDSDWDYDVNHRRTFSY